MDEPGYLGSASRARFEEGVESGSLPFPNRMTEGTKTVAYHDRYRSIRCPAASKTAPTVQHIALRPIVDTTPTVMLEECTSLVLG